MTSSKPWSKKAARNNLSTKTVMCASSAFQSISSDRWLCLSSFSMYTFQVQEQSICNHLPPLLKMAYGFVFAPFLPLKISVSGAWVDLSQYIYLVELCFWNTRLKNVLLNGQLWWMTGYLHSTILWTGTYNSIKQCVNSLTGVRKVNEELLKKKNQLQMCLSSHCE